MPATSPPLPMEEGLMEEIMANDKTVWQKLYVTVLDADQGRWSDVEPLFAQRVPVTCFLCPA